MATRRGGREQVADRDIRARRVFIAGLSAGGGSFGDRFVDPWLTSFALGVGVLTLALFAFLAAVFLTMETRDRDLRRFRAVADSLQVD